MLTSAEKYRLDQACGNKVVDGMDDVQGNALPIAMLGSFEGFSTNASSPIYYNPRTKTIAIKENGAVISGLNLSGISIVVDANNVTIKNCTFNDISTGYFTIIQNAGYSGMTVTNCTFNGGNNVNLAGFVMSTTGYTAVTDNSFIDTPSHAVQIPDGVVSNNYFSGGGYVPATHADAISVINTTGPVLISGNYIDWTNNANAAAATNNAIRITTELGNTSNVTITNNVILGGQDSVYVDYGATTAASGVFCNINVYGNFIGDYVYSAIYPVVPAGVTIGANTDVGFDNPALSAAAWSAYQSAGGVVTDSLIVATAGETTITAAAIGTTTLYGNGQGGEYLDGGKSLTVFVGGAQAQYLYGGSGKNIYSYLAIADSTPQSADDIINFKVASDVINLSSLNANPGGATPANFTFIGGASFSSAGGEVRVVQNAADNETLVEADLVGDDSPDLEIRLNGLLNLTAANFALTSTQYQADIASYTSIATFLGSEASLNQVTGGFSIVDSAANVQANLAALEAEAGHVDAVTLTSGALSVNAAAFVADQAILNKVAGGFGVADTGANFSAQIGALEKDASAITSVTLSDSTATTPDVVTLSAANAVADASILAKIASPYVLDATAATGGTLTGHGAGLTIDIGNQGVTTATGGATGDEFIFSAHFGAATLADFGQYSSASRPDTIALSTTDFANWSTLLADGRQVGANTVFTSADGASLTLDGVALTSLQRASATLQADFKFHA